MPHQVRVVAAHDASYPDPIAVRQGDRVLVGRRDDAYPGWVWCRAPDGREGWMPERYLELARSEHGGVATVEAPGEVAAHEATGDAPREAVATTDYDARELGVRPGERLEVIVELAGWLLCERGDGGRGWVPAATVAPLDDPSSAR